MTASIEYSNDQKFLNLTAVFNKKSQEFALKNLKAHEILAPIIEKCTQAFSTPSYAALSIKDRRTFVQEFFNGHLEECADRIKHMDPADYKDLHFFIQLLSYSMLDAEVLGSDSMNIEIPVNGDDKKDDDEGFDEEAEPEPTDPGSSGGKVHKAHGGHRRGHRRRNVALAYTGATFAPS